MLGSRALNVNADRAGAACRESVDAAAGADATVSRRAERATVRQADRPQPSAGGEVAQQPKPAAGRERDEDCGALTQA